MSPIPSRYNSLWDWSTWLLMAVSAAACLWPILLTDDLAEQIVITAIAAAFIGVIIIFLKGIYYIIDGKNLIVYQFCKPTVLPITKIESVRPNKSLLAAPASSITNRLAIKFSDRKVLKSSMPLIISPERQKEFIAQLLSINPAIKH